MFRDQSQKSADTTTDFSTVVAAVGDPSRRPPAQRHITTERDHNVRLGLILFDPPLS